MYIKLFKDLRASRQVSTSWLIPYFLYLVFFASKARVVTVIRCLIYLKSRTLRLVTCVSPREKEDGSIEYLATLEDMPSKFLLDLTEDFVLGEVPEVYQLLDKTPHTYKVILSSGNDLIKGDIVAYEREGILRVMRTDSRSNKSMQNYATSANCVHLNSCFIDRHCSVKNCNLPSL